MKYHVFTCFMTGCRITFKYRILRPTVVKNKYSKWIKQLYVPNVMLVEAFISFV